MTYRPGKRYRDKTITSRKAFIQELERTRQQGYGEDREEFDDHIRCLGIPIFDRLNQAVAGLSISFPTFRYDEAREPRSLRCCATPARDLQAAGLLELPARPAEGKARGRSRQGVAVQESAPRGPLKPALVDAVKVRIEALRAAHP